MGLRNGLWSRLGIACLGFGNFGNGDDAGRGGPKKRGAVSAARRAGEQRPGASERAGGKAAL